MTFYFPCYIFMEISCLGAYVALDLKKIPTIKTAEAFRERLGVLGLELPIDDKILESGESPVGRPLDIGSFRLGNRYAIHPMEGWDATPDGLPTPEVFRRWDRFALSGAKLLWGMEAVAVHPDGRANPNQLILNERSLQAIAKGMDHARELHVRRFGTADDLMMGLQLTHSGRFCRPNAKDVLEPKIAYAHPILNPKFNLPMDYPVLTDDEVERLIEDFIHAAVLTEKAGITFVDIKQCHGYLLHEFLSAFTRKGRFGGDTLEQRSEVARRIITGIRTAAPGLTLGVRLSAFDFVPFRPDPGGAVNGNPGPGIPEDFTGFLPYRFGFGVNPHNPIEYDLTEPKRYLGMLKEWGVSVVNISCGSPYYNPHIQRPALYPPSDGYQPAEDPLVNVARQAAVVRELKRAVPDLPLVASGLTYLQEFFPQVAQALVREGWTDIVGMGRMVLSYPDIIADSLEKGEISTRMICRTFSDCTTAPRNGLKSGCYPLDDHYKKMEEAEALKQAKKAGKERLKAMALPGASILVNPLKPV